MTYSPKNPRRGTRRVGWREGPKSLRRLFLNEMRRSNNVLRGLERAHITWSTYISWLESGHITKEKLDEAERVFMEKHPNKDMLPARQTDQQLEDWGIGTTGVVVDDVLESDGWYSVGGYDDDW